MVTLHETFEDKSHLYLAKSSVPTLDPCRTDNKKVGDAGVGMEHLDMTHDVGCGTSTLATPPSFTTVKTSYSHSCSYSYSLSLSLSLALRDYKLNRLGFELVSFASRW